MPLNQLMYLSIRRESIELIKLFIHGCVAANEGKLLSLLRGQLPECATCRFMPKPAFVQDIEDISWLRTCWCCSRYVSFKLKIILLVHLLGCLPYVIEIVSYFWRVAWVPNFALNMPSLHVVSLSLSLSRVCVCLKISRKKLNAKQLCELFEAEMKCACLNSWCIEEIMLRGAHEHWMTLCILAICIINCHPHSIISLHLISSSVGHGSHLWTQFKLKGFLKLFGEELLWHLDNR